MRFKSRKKKKFISSKHIICFFIISFIITLFLSFKLINKKVTPILISYAESKATSLATLVITQAVNDYVFEKMNSDDLFITEKDDNNNIVSIDFNPVTVNKLLNLVTNYVQEYIQKIEDGDIDSLGVTDSIFNNYDTNNLKNGIIYEIPSGVVFKNSLLSNLGPKIPVRINLIGDVISDIDTNITNYGINNALVKVTLNVQVNMQVILPFAKKDMKAETNVPVAIKIVQGTVPNLYYNLGSLNK